MKTGVDFLIMNGKLSPKTTARDIYYQYKMLTYLRKTGSTIECPALEQVLQNVDCTTKFLSVEGSLVRKQNDPQ